MDQLHSNSINPASTTQGPSPCEVVLDEGYVHPPGGDQAQPACFGAGQVRIPERSEDDRLCSTCMSLGRLNSTHWEDINNFREVTVNHHHSIDALITSAREGCHLCGLLLIALEEDYRLSQEPRGGWIGMAGTNSASLTGIIRLKFQRVKSTVPWTGIAVDEVNIILLCGGLIGGEGGRLICEAMDTNHLNLPKACLPSGSDTNTGSSASLSRIKAWLNICRSSHPACFQVDSQPPPLPTRVISVGSKGSSECSLVFGGKASGYYATLSHCWGDLKNRPLLTTDRTLPCRQRGIKDEELPKTFRDAIHVCREMGIEYIWIDSLCIIQEQETQEDWAKEAPKMGSVYGNSILTISAAAAADSRQGCFKERLGLFSWPCPVVLFGQACYLLRNPTLAEYSLGDPGDLGWGSPNFLAQRAWALQEQVLSRRSIIFSDTRLIWRCSTLSTNEKYPLGIPHDPGIFVDHRRFLHCVVNGITSFVPKRQAVDIYTCWYKIVAEFKSRKITYEEDRLPAIAGIAKRFGMAVNDSYHAGLWRHDMILGLLWHTTSVTGKCTTKSARAPSWSWASVNVSVRQSIRLLARPDASRTPTSPLVDVVDVTDPKTCEDHPFGVTSRASLSLSGVLLAVMQDEQENSGLALIVNGIRSANSIANFFPDVWDAERPDQATLFCLPVSVRHSTNHGDIRGDGELYKASWKRSLAKGLDEFEHFDTLYCLILQAVERNQNTYTRVGLCKVGRHNVAEISRMALFGERRPIFIV